MTLNAIWFILVFVLLGGYAVLDGFDLGAGVVTLFTKDESERRIIINAIGPVWDGNEVWLLTGGGALFAAFPAVYATVFSGFYLALMIVLAALIFRAVAMEFRGKIQNPRWRRFWDSAFGTSSLLLAVLFGVAFGNVLRGVEITSEGIYGGSFFDLLNLFALVVGLLGLSVFTMHGAIYLCNKCEPNTKHLAKWANLAWVASILLFAIATGLKILWLHAPLAPAVWVALLVIIIAAAIVPISVLQQRYKTAFIASSATIAGMMGLGALSLFPRLLPALNDADRSLTIYNSSSSHLTLLTMFIIALIGMPCVIAYTAVIHHIFRGKVILTADSY